ncbi:M16 family metallopeptidase [Shewanella maritima]|nr:insulinase family protein [Shewanella maritima]
MMRIGSLIPLINKLAATFLLLMLVACQHKQTNGESSVQVAANSTSDSAATITPTLPQFDSQATNLPPLAAKLSYQSPPAPLSHKLNDASYQHLWSLSQFPLSTHRFSLVGISQTRAIANPDILLKAFELYAQQLALIEQAALRELAVVNAKPEQITRCLNSISFSATLHRIVISMHCEASYETKLKLAKQLWQQLANLQTKTKAGDKITGINLDLLKRKLKLDSHIGAFTGSEINLAYRKRLLGISHPYASEVNNQQAIDSLTIESLTELFASTYQSLQWHVFSTAGLKEPTRDVQFLNTQSVVRHAQTKKQANRSADTQNLTLKPIAIIDKPGTVQTQLRIGYLFANSVTDARYNRLACESLAALLGRSYSGRLFYDLRETRGLTYGVYAYCVDAPLGQYLTIYGSTDKADTTQFVSGILQHVALLQRQSPQDAELKALKDYLLGKQQLRHDSQRAVENSFLTPWIMGQVAQGTELQDRDQAFYDALEQLSADELSRFAQLYLTNPVIVLRGDKDDIAKPLVKGLEALANSGVLDNKLSADKVLEVERNNWKIEEIKP